MLTRNQLEAIQDLLDGQQPSEQTILELKKVITSELWIISNQLTKKEKALIAQAEAEGKVQVVGRIIGDLPDPEVKRAVARAKSGGDLLNALGML